MLKIIIIALITVFLSLIIKQRSPEISMMISIAGGLIIVFLSLDSLSQVFNYYNDLSSTINIDSGIIKIAIKIVCVGFITEFISDLAKDFGNSAIASKLIFGGKVVICVITLPVVKELVSLLFFFY